MITVLMATYQGRQYLEQQLDTILAQTVPVKILISDDGSDDGTREMLDNYAGWSGAGGSASQNRAYRWCGRKLFLADAGSPEG